VGDVHRECEGPLAGWIGPFASWLVSSGCAPGRVRRAVLAFGRLSSWLAERDVGLADLDEDVIDECVLAEQARSGSKFPAAFQYLPLAKRFLASRELVVLRGPSRRDRAGMPRLPAGPLAEVVVDLVAWLRAEGYAPGTATSIACTAARLGAWMAGARLRIEDLDDVVLDRFVAAQAGGPARHPSSARRIVAVRKFLRAVGLLNAAQVASPAATPVDEVLEAWGRYECDERGAGLRWVREQHGWARVFLEQATGPDGQVRWDCVEVPRVNEYVAACGQGYSLSSRRHLVSAMRSLLRWAFWAGALDRQLSRGVLGPPRRVLVGLPQALTPGQVEAIKAAADTAAVIGLRNYAVVVMISRLGLRVGEVAGLRLDDIDWRNGQVTVSGKGGRVLTLPLPADVGEALVTYLRDARRPTALDRAVFVRDRAPRRGLSGKGISNIVAVLARRAGLGVVHAHRLRHTAATEVLAGGGSVVEARELLGHARTDTTMIYARTDLNSLGALVTAWATVPRS
jgi:site-specific recombinase XerD